MRNFQGIAFISPQTFREIFKPVLVYLYRFYFEKNVFQSGIGSKNDVSCNLF